MTRRSIAALEDELRALEGATDPAPARLGEVLAELAWELALDDRARSEALSRRAAALDEAHDLPAVRARVRRNAAFQARMGDDLGLAIDLGREAATLAEALGDDLVGAAAEDTLANVHTTLGSLDRALAHGLRSLECSRRAGDRRGLAWAKESIARLHRRLGDLDEARRWLDEALAAFTALDHPVGRGRALSLRATICGDENDLDGAQAALEEARGIWSRLAFDRGLRWCDLELARTLARRGAHARALAHVEAARGPGHAPPSADLLAAAATVEGALLRALGRDEEAEAALLQALDGADPIRGVDDRIAAHGHLGDLYEDRGDPAAALAHVKARLRLTRAQNDREMLARARNMQLGMRVAAAEREAQVTERLLYGILPKPIVRELKLHGRAEPVLHGAATVLFTDLVGFTRIAEGMHPRDLVAALDALFGAFDEVIRRRGLEKVKTIGDAYMAVAGIPERNHDHAVDAALAALELRDVVRRLAADPTQPAWAIRIGLHSGPLVAGVIGRDKPFYDVWGDTVNLAARMESSGAADQINVSGATQALLAPFFVTEPRGRLEAKNKGLVDMHFVRRLRPEYAADSDGVRPRAGWRETTGLGLDPSEAG